jgi:HIP---CoA ligase
MPAESASGFSGTSLPAALESSVRRFAGGVAVEDGEVRLTFEELWQKVLEAGQAFLAAGIERGDRVAIWAPNLWEWIVAALGLEIAGGVLVPINTRFKGREALHVLEKSRARMLFTVEEFLGQRYVDLLRAAGDARALERIVLFRGAHAGAEAWGAFVERGAQVAVERVLERARSIGPDDVLDILFTSGTTGAPKGVVTTHAQNLRTFGTWSDVVGLRAGDRYLIVNPFFHAFGYKAGFLSAILRGATVLPHAVFDVGAVLDRIARERVNVLPGPPTLYQSLLAHPELAGRDLSSLRLAVTGAAVIPVVLIERMRKELSFETVLTAYGLTETCGVVTMCRTADDPETIATTSGTAIPGVEVRCVDDAGRELPAGEPGEIVVRGYNVMQSYFEDPEATREVIDAQGFLHTGDIGILDARGYLRITDRKKDMFIVGGFNCYPAEIEGLMLRHPAIAQVAVVGAPDPRLGEVGVAFVVPKPGLQPEPDAIAAFCRQEMANYKVPRAIELVTELPTNAVGKVTKFALRERARSVIAAKPG